MKNFTISRDKLNFDRNLQSYLSANEVATVMAIAGHSVDFEHSQLTTTVVVPAMSISAKENTLLIDI